MEIIRTMEVSCEELHAFIEQSVCEDIKNATGKTISPSTIKKGYKYHKELRNRKGSRVTAHIRGWEDHFYEVAFDNPDGVSVLSYSYRPLEDMALELTYHEEFTSSPAYAKKSGLSTILANRSGQKRVKKTLDQIERYIIQQRKAKAE